ncbi:hypothetical protein Vadar_024084 [Vaccinium darrowii]|uniref:Uncharacterized protein n=1 Tax=Vaccinium darrowii TaxID=229202 RepID=A0ACB7YYS4_9ERIC|nr:hypothetical protein Vadar_024084 [Vaccinium darrowii]
MSCSSNSKVSTNSRASSSNWNPNLSPHENCFCGERSPLRTSYTEENPGRRFLGCINYKTSRKCKHFEWVDPPMCVRGMDFGPSIIKMVRKAEGKNAELKEQLVKVGRENAELKRSAAEKEHEIEQLMNIVQKLNAEVQQMSTKNKELGKK